MYPSLAMALTTRTKDCNIRSMSDNIKHDVLLLWRYNSGRVLAFSTISFHLRRSWTCSVHFISFIFFKSFLTSSSHQDLGLPAGLPMNGCHLCILLTMPISGIQLTCICLMAGVRLVKRDVRPSHDVTSDHHANLAHPAACISQYDRKTVRHTGVWGEGGSLHFMADERTAFNPTPASSAPSKAHTAWAHRLIQT
jgi:hypothetical protein